VAQGTFLVTLKPSYFDGMQFADAKRREQKIQGSHGLVKELDKIFP
jgi:hypothetical protein